MAIHQFSIPKIQNVFLLHSGSPGKVPGTKSPGLNKSESSGTFLQVPGLPCALFLLSNNQRITYCKILTIGNADCLVMKKIGRFSQKGWLGLAS